MPGAGHRIRTQEIARPGMEPTLVFVPCLSGAPWDLDALTPLRGRAMRTMRLPEGLDEIERYVHVLVDEVADLDEYVLVGDSFGAMIALGMAIRQPPGLRGLVLSGGFAANPITNPFLRAGVEAARLLPGSLYRQVVLRLHATALASPHDEDGEVPWTCADSHRLFVESTPWKTYTARTRAALSVDYRADLGRVQVPALIITPSHDQLIGEDAARQMLGGIPDAREVILPRTGHMFRFSHPLTYAQAIAGFVREEVEQRLSA